MTSSPEHTEAKLQLLSAALNAAIDGILITDASGMITWANTAATQLAGYSLDEMIGQPVEMLSSDHHPVSFHRHFWDEIRAGRAWSGEFVNRRKDGSLYTESTTITPIRDAAGIITHYVAVKRDTTKEKELQAQFLHAQKMEVVGRLAGSIAHDFNNLLGVINGTADLAVMSVPPGDELRADLETIRQTGERAAALTRQLVAFSRHELLEPRSLDINQVIRDLAPMMQRVVGDPIQFVVTLKARESRITADPGQLEQILLNLVVNAKDAMPAGGTLTIATDDTPAGVRVAVADTGQGMTAAVRARIFEPFFTTKDTARGTGLGLPTVLKIVQGNRGTIDVVSEVGQGTTVIIIWPRGHEEPQAALLHAAPLTETPAGATTVMVVEDDTPLLRLTARILGDAGYTVLTAGSAEAALPLLDANPQVALLVSDVVLPGISGVQLADRATQTRTSLKVLYMTGYTDDGLGAVEAKAVEGQLLKKPFTAAQLVTKVRSVLG